MIPRLTRRWQTPHPEWLVIFGAALLAGITMLWNIGSSPDTQYDEVVYTRAAQQVAQSGRLTWTNSPIFVHPPLSFLTQAGWLRVLGLGFTPLEDAIIGARVLVAGVMVFAILLLGLLAANLMPEAGRRRGLLLVGIVVALAATDPVLLRYGRLALIEPFALAAALLTLCLAMWLRTQRPLIYISAVGLATGLTLLTKEVTVFLLLTPVVHALLGRDWRRAGTTFAGFLWGAGLWLLFPLWAVALGLTSDFVDVKFATFQRLLGLLQITGWNRPGASFLSAIGGQAGQYASSYLLLAGGAVATLWLLTKSVTGASRWLLAWLLTSYAFGAYTVLLGTLNEQFFVYILPAAIVGTVLMGDAMVARFVAARAGGARSSRALAVAATALVAVFGFAVVGWARFSVSDNDGVFRTAAFVRAELAPCANLSTTGDPDKYTYLLPGHTISAFATAPGALSHGVHLFVLSDKDVAAGYGNATPELTSWVRSRGTLLASFPSATYRGLQLWQVPSDPYDPLADIEPIANGVFVTTEGSRCGGFPVLDDPKGTFAASWQALGGKAVVGPPRTGSWAVGPTAYQVFAGAVLSTKRGKRVAAMPIVPRLARALPGAYRNAQLPPVTEAPGGRLLTDDQVRARLTDPAIAAAYLRTTVTDTSRGALDRARELLGDPVGPATAMPDGAVRQAFTGGVFERPASSGTVRLAPIGPLVIQVGLVRPPSAAITPVAPPPLSHDLGPSQPTSVQPFLISLLAGLALYVGLPVALVVLTRVRRRPGDGALPR